MSELDLSFRPLEFQKTSHGDLRPPIFDGDHTYGDDYGAGLLVSLACARKEKALLSVVRFTAGPDAATAGWALDDVGEVEFILFEKKGRYIGGINRQAPGKFVWMAGENIQILDIFGPGSAPGHRGRRAAHYFCQHHIRGFHGTAKLAVTIYLRRGWLGGWKEIVVKVPKNGLYVARL